MRATRWEFENRAIIIGALFGVAFVLSSVDHRNAAVALADIIASRGFGSSYGVARAIFGAAAVVTVAAAFVRTWASAYLAADVVYAADVKTAALVADGPYRYVRNPLYFSNVLLAVGIGVMASRVGFVALTLLMVAFSYRLILREEAELLAAQGDRYAAYRARVPRLLPSISPRVPSASTPARWSNGVTGELWYWGFALAMAGFALTLSVPLFFVILGASVATLFFGSKG